MSAGQSPGKAASASVAGRSIAYHANGNILSDGTNEFTWNALNQVVALNGVSLQYDAFGRRIRMQLANPSYTME